MTDRRLHQETLVIASHNPGKVREIEALLAPHGVSVRSAADLDLPEPEETGTTYRENALLKARAAAQGAGVPALADDSGLSVPALDGAPGVFSARWAGPERDFNLAMQRVHDALEVTAPRDATFVCVLAVVWPDGEDALFEGRVDGTLVWPPRGDKGFGYDPMFVPKGEDQTFGEMDPDRKHAMSHRARAFDNLMARLL